MKVSPARKCCPETHREKLFFHLFFGYLQGEGDSKHTFGLVGRSFSREVLQVLAVGDDACETVGDGQGGLRAAIHGVAKSCT